MKIILTLIILYSASFTSSKILSFVEYCRHGARNPESKDKYEPIDWKDRDFGQLTATGMRMHYILGRELRKKYVEELKLLPEQYKANVIEVHASNWNRTYMSAYSQMIGLWGTTAKKLDPIPIQIENAQPPIKVREIGKIKIQLGLSSIPQNIQLTPVHHVDPIDNFAIISNNFCPKFNKIKEEFQQSEYFKNYTHINYDLTIRQKLAQALNATYEEMDFSQATSIYSWMYIYKTHGFQYPQVLEQFYPYLKELSAWKAINGTYPDDYSAQLVGSEFLRQVFEHFYQVIRKQTEILFALYSGHDSVTEGIVRQIKLQPESETYRTAIFASNLIFELHQKTNEHDTNNKKISNGDYFVRVFFNGIQRSVSTCDLDSKLDDFKACIGYIIPDLEKECNSA